MKKTIKIISLLFAFVLSVSCVAGCKKEGANTDGAKKEYESTGYKIIDQGVSEYVVLLPASPSENEYMAADEFGYFMKAATQADVTVVEEDEYTVEDTSAVISIGDTAHADKVGVKTDGTLGRSGYVMKTVGNQLFIRSDGDGLGCVYAVYDLLESTIGYRYYYTDEIYYEEKDTVELYNYDIVADPSFDFRAMSTWNAFLYANEDYMRRMRTFKSNEGFAWGGQVHTQLMEGGVISPSEWFDSHKYGTVKTVEVEGEEVEVADHWFSKTGDQLCWTAGEEMYEQAAKDVIERIQSEPSKTNFMVGQADTLLFCDCDRCKAAKAEWALNDAGLQMHFINRVAAYVNAWLAENAPEREIRLIVLVYYATEAAPVKQDENGKWVAYSDKVEPMEDNIDFYFAPIYTDYSKNLTDPENADVYANLLRWKEFLAGKENRFLLYTYDTNFHHFFYNFNNFDTFTMQAAEYSKQGIDFIHSQGANGTNQPTFQEMRYFVESQILWDTSRNYDELVNEFMEHFYKDASAEIREYYDLTRMRYEQMKVLNGEEFTSIYADIEDKSIWTEGVVDTIDGIFARAYGKIEHYKTDDPDTYTKLYNRIKELELTLIYTKLKYYASNYTQTEKNQLVDEFNYYVLKFDINVAKEGGDATVGMYDSLKK